MYLSVDADTQSEHSSWLAPDKGAFLFIAHSATVNKSLSFKIPRILLIITDAEK